MPGIVTGDNSCVVQSSTGSGDECKFPMTTSTGQCSSKVFVGGIGVVCEGDQVAPHPKRGCSTDSSVLTTFSSKVFIGGKGVAREGDNYTGDNVIMSSSTKVFCA